MRWEKIMTYEEIVAKVRKTFKNTDVSMIDEHLAYQFNIEGEGEGAFYVEVKEGQLYIEPYEYYDGTTIVGIDAEMAQALCDKLGYELEIQDIEFDAIINAVQSGKADIGVAGMTVTEDRLKSIDFSDSYTTATQVIVVRK